MCGQCAKLAKPPANNIFTSCKKKIQLLCSLAPLKASKVFSDTAHTHSRPTHVREGENLREIWKIRPPSAECTALGKEGDANDHTGEENRCGEKWPRCATDGLAKKNGGKRFESSDSFSSFLLPPAIYQELERQKVGRDFGPSGFSDWDFHERKWTYRKK